MTNSKMESNFQITGIGEILWDIFPEGKRFGGAPANFACQAQALGTNTHMVRFFDEDRFEIYALRDIQANEELTHLYKSLQWRGCFKKLNEKLQK